MSNSIAQLMGRDESHLIRLANGHRLQQPAAAAFEHLREDARLAGFELEIASSFRSFERQCLIWNEKALGVRPVQDEHGAVIDIHRLTGLEKVHAIMRFSALPGTSRHHWGTDLDVFDANAMGADYQLQLSPEEVKRGGMFDPLHCWLDKRMAANQSHGFFRPYQVDTGGVAAERWHLSFSPLSSACERLCRCNFLKDGLQTANIELWNCVEAHFEELFQRYITVPSGWCSQHR